MKYALVINKDDLLEFDFLERDLRKKKIEVIFKNNIKNIIQGFIAFSIIFIVSLGLIALNMKIDIETILFHKSITLYGLDIKVILLLSSYLPFLVILLFQIFFTGIFFRVYYRIRYSYLIGSFEIYIKDDTIILDSKYRKLFADLSKCEIKKKDSILVLTKENGFKIVLPIEKIENGKSLESTIIKINKGEVIWYINLNIINLFMILDT